MDKNLSYYIQKNVRYHSRDVAETARNELDQGTPIEDIPDVVSRLFQPPDIETSLNLHAQVKQACDEYTRDHMPKIKMSADWIIQDINHYLKKLKSAFGNAVFFGIHKAEFSEDMIDFLQELRDQLQTANSRVNNFEYYIPECSGGCDNCLLSYRNGCRKENYLERFERWKNNGEKEF